MINVFLCNIIYIVDMCKMILYLFFVAGFSWYTTIYCLMSLNRERKGEKGRHIALSLSLSLSAIVND